MADWRNPKTTKLEQLAELAGMELDELLEEAAIDSVCPGICMNLGCTYTTKVEPDQDKGWCEACETNTVESALMLAELI